MHHAALSRHRASIRASLSRNEFSASVIMPAQKRRMADKALTEDNGFLGHKKVSDTDRYILVVMIWHGMLCRLLSPMPKCDHKAVALTKLCCSCSGSSEQPAGELGDIRVLWGEQC